ADLARGDADHLEMAGQSRRRRGQGLRSPEADRDLDGDERPGPPALRDQPAGRQLDRLPARALLAGAGALRHQVRRVVLRHHGCPPRRAGSGYGARLTTLTTPLPLWEREGPIATRWEGEGCWQRGAATPLTLPMLRMGPS